MRRLTACAFLAVALFFFLRPAAAAAAPRTATAG